MFSSKTILKVLNITKNIIYFYVIYALYFRID